MRFNLKKTLIAAAATAAVVGANGAYAVTADQLLSDISAGRITEAATERGYVWIKALGHPCGWSNHDAEYRARSMARKLEHVFNAIKDGKPGNERQAAQHLADTIDRSNLYARCWSKMKNYEVSIGYSQPLDLPGGMRHHMQF